MFFTAFVLAAAFVPQGPSGVAPSLVINEFSYDDSSTDKFEFVEIHNAGKTAVDLTGWRLTSSDPSGPNFSLALNSVMLESGGYYVIGNALVPNVNQVIAVNTLENDNESLALLDPSSVVVDSLIYEANKGIAFAPGLAEGEGIWDNHQMTDASANALSLSRVVDGWDTGDNGLDFLHRPWTPGASNNVGGNTYGDAYDSVAVGTAVPGWAGNFKNARSIDPTVVGPLVGLNNLNPNAIPASPQGGNAAIFWDETGGGNYTAWLGSPGIECSFDAWVYLAPSPVVVAAQTETWSIGINGTSNGVYNIPDPSGVLGAGFIANGNVGFSWTYEALNGGVANLYLIDHNNGGWGVGAQNGPTILATIPISTGTNDGWRRLMISVSDTTLEARFGGTVGNPDGTLYTQTITPGYGSVYVGYRELVTANATLRPVTLDDVRVETCSRAWAHWYGHGVPGAFGIPSIDQGAIFALGFAGQVDIGNMIPSNTGVVLIGLRTPPVSLVGAGAQPGSELYLFILDYVGVPTDPGGLGSLSMNVPNDRTLCGAELAFQALQIDLSIAATLPISLTQGMNVRIGL
ncbi:MAG: lamin tail domain-containing protein [Planctomycetes bacterium]|nr:lamin tail domain-containing protein [Planctomycetota bacterium]